MEFTFLCKDDTGITTESWEGSICPLDCTEYEITAHGSCFHLVIGQHCYSRYIYIPTWGIAMDISYPDDRFWNREHLLQAFPELSLVDVITIVEALAAIKTYNS